MTPSDTAGLVASLRMAAEAYREQARDATADLMLEAATSLESLSRPVEGSWRDIATAPKDGTRVLLLLKDPLPEVREDLLRWNGIPFVGRSYGDISEWQFAAPVGHGGFPDEWMVGWQPITAFAAPVFPTPVMGEERMREILANEYDRLGYGEVALAVRENRAGTIIDPPIAAMREVAELTATGGK